MKADYNTNKRNKVRETIIDGSQLFREYKKNNICLKYMENKNKMKLIKRTYTQNTHADIFREMC